MWNENETYFDYVEIRRRVERRLASGLGLAAHTAVFVLAVFTLSAVFAPWSYSITAATGANLLMFGWSLLLALHGLLAYRNAGTGQAQRNFALERELAERVDAGDTELLATPRHAFRVRALLDEDIRQRAGWIVGVDAFLLGNVVFWLSLLFMGTRYSSPWPVVPMLAFLWFPGIYVVNQVRRRLRDGKLRTILAVRPATMAGAMQAKQKRSFDAELERYSRLTDDGELVDIPEDWAVYDRSKRG